LKRLALLGASGHGKVIADAAILTGWQEIVFFDDAWPRVSTNAHWPVIGNTETLLASHEQFDGAIVTIGDCAIRMSKQTTLSDAGVRMVTIIHPRSTVSPFACIGPGSVIMAGAVVNVDTMIGEACIVNTGASVDHDCVLEDGAHVSPGARLSGNVHVGASSWVGVGASVRQGLRIGRSCVVGAGAVVVKSVADGLTVVGNPARPLIHR
jgi:sugar O-acyltransferase (sialic acid O-acetyltransferase NeuD family)